MGLSDWIASKILSDKTLDSLIEKALPKIQDRLDTQLKESVIRLLEDEDIAYGVGVYADALYNRVSKKFFGAIGGTQKGLNYQTGQIQDDLLGDVFQDGQINVMGILRLIMSGKLKQLGGSQRPTGLARIPEHMK